MIHMTIQKKMCWHWTPIDESGPHPAFHWRWSSSWSWRLVIFGGFRLTWKLKHWNKTQILRLNHIELWFLWGSNPQWPVQFRGNQQSRPRSRVVTSPKKKHWEPDRSTWQKRCVSFKTAKTPTWVHKTSKKPMVQTVKQESFWEVKEGDQTAVWLSYLFKCRKLDLDKHKGRVFWKSRVSRFFWYFERLVHHITKNKDT